MLEEVRQEESLLEDVRWALEDVDGSVAVGGCREAPVSPGYTSVLLLGGARALDPTVGSLGRIPEDRVGATMPISQATEARPHELCELQSQAHKW